MLAKPIPKEEKNKVRLIQVLVHASGDPDLQITGGRGGQSQKNVFSAFRALVWSKNKREARAPPGPFPWICHFMQFSKTVNIVSHLNRNDSDLRQERYKLPLSNGQSLFQACTGSD